MSVWKVAQQLVHALDKRGEGSVAALLTRLSGEGEVARDLAHRLYTTCERKGWAQPRQTFPSTIADTTAPLQLAVEPDDSARIRFRPIAERVGWLHGVFALCALRSIGDNRGDAPGGLGRVAAGADGLAGHGAPLADAELNGCETRCG